MPWRSMPRPTVPTAAAAVAALPRPTVSGVALRVGIAGAGRATRGRAAGSCCSATSRRASSSGSPRAGRRRCSAWSWRGDAALRRRARGQPPQRTAPRGRAAVGRPAGQPGRRRDDPADLAVREADAGRARLLLPRIGGSSSAAAAESLELRSWRPPRPTTREGLGDRQAARGRTSVGPSRCRVRSPSRGRDRPPRPRHGRRSRPAALLSEPPSVALCGATAGLSAAGQPAQPARRHAPGPRAAGADPRRPAGASSAERLATLRAVLGSASLGEAADAPRRPSQHGRLPRRPARASWPAGTWPTRTCASRSSSPPDSCKMHKIEDPVGY